jgi:ubiquinone/menaquinone biosynthesis C-methylase UbiE
MDIGRQVLMRTFGLPRGLLGQLGGMILARTNRRYAAWAIELLAPQPQDSVLEVGFGPGVGIELLATKAHRVAGADPSTEMLRQATKRNAAAISEGRIELCRASAEHLPFPDASFDKALAVNSMQLWPDVTAGLRELSRVLKPDCCAALAFTAYSGQQRDGIDQLLASAGFHNCQVVETKRAFCVLACSRTPTRGRMAPSCSSTECETRL